MKCVICNATFSLKLNLKPHSAPVHEGNKLIRCDIFTANFTRETEMKIHSNSVHEEKKSFKCEICTCGGHSCQMRIEGQNGFLNHGQFSTQGCVYIQPTKIFTNLGQFCVDAAQGWGYEIESTRSSP